MKEYIKKFENPSVGDNYSIESIPFMTSVETTGQNLVCNQPGKKLVNISETLVIQSAGPEMVDLGLSVKWAKANIGATCGDTAESWYGGYYAWGETETKSDYNLNNYIHAEGNPYVEGQGTWIKYAGPNGLVQLESVDDVATHEYGEDYMMPTYDDLQELKQGTDQENVTDYNGIIGLNGIKFMKKTDHSTFIFIPNTGYYNNSSLISYGIYAFLWTSSLYFRVNAMNQRIYDQNGWASNFQNTGEPYINCRYRGMPVRAVQHVSNS